MLNRTTVLRKERRFYLFHTARAGEVIVYDSNVKFQCVIGVAHKIALYSVRVLLLRCSSLRAKVLGIFLLKGGVLEGTE